MPFENFILLVIYHQKDARREIIIYSCVKPKFLVDREVRLLDIFKRDLSFEQGDVPVYCIDIDYQWLTVVIYFKLD